MIAVPGGWAGKHLLPILASLLSRTSFLSFLSVLVSFVPWAAWFLLILSAIASPLPPSTSSRCPHVADLTWLSSAILTVPLHRQSHVSLTSPALLSLPSSKVDVCMLPSRSSHCQTLRYPHITPESPSSRCLHPHRHLYRIPSFEDSAVLPLWVPVYFTTHASLFFLSSLPCSQVDSAFPDVRLPTPKTKRTT